MKIYKSFVVAGFKYYGGFQVFDKLKAGKKLKLKLEEDNKYDDNAIEVYYKKVKLGYIPKYQNYSISQILKNGHNIFEAYVQMIDEKKNIVVAIVIKEK